MERRPIIPDRNVVLLPSVADLEVVVLRDVHCEVVQHVGGLVACQLDDAFREAGQNRNRNNISQSVVPRFCHAMLECDAAAQGARMHGCVTC